MKKTVDCQSFVTVEGELQEISALSVETREILSGNLRCCLLQQLFLGEVEFTPVGNL